MIPCRGRTVEDNGGHSKWDGRRGGRGGLLRARTNKRRILGPEWSMSEVGNPPPHNLYKPHGLVDSINNNNYQAELSNYLLVPLHPIRFQFCSVIILRFVV